MNLVANIVPGCWTLEARYELAAACGGAGAANDVSAAAGCAPITKNGVIFPATPTLANATNTCVTALTLPTVAAVTNFTATYAIGAPGGALGAFQTPALAQTALNAATPGCWTISARYELNAACGTAAAINATSAT